MTDLQETIHATGHENVTAQHSSTFEFTSDDYLTPAGDCIMGINADRVPASFDRRFVRACQDHSARIVATIEVGDHVQRLVGRGHPDLTMEDDRSLVGRTSDYVDDRTIAVDMDGAAVDIAREIVAKLAAGENVTVTLSVE